MTGITYDIAVIGAGCAGYQLLYHLAQQPGWAANKVLLVKDDVPLQRSWCFWGRGQHPLQHLVSKSWPNIEFRSPGFGQTQSIAPYDYHYIAGDDFFRFFEQTFLPLHPNIDVIHGSMANLTQTAGVFIFSTEIATFRAKHVYSSHHQTPANPGRWNLTQHFRGWFVSVESPIFDPGVATLMDFCVPQQDAVQFAYVLPFKATEALVEITAFSTLTSYPTVRYDEMLADYMRLRYPGVAYTVTATEQGRIPMTNYTFNRFGGAGELLLGTSAGMVKSTTGYAFQRIGRDCAQLARAFSTQKPAAWPITTGRFCFYDRLLLGILTEQPELGHTVFADLYRHTPFAKILSFLDEESSLADEVAMISRLPYTPFLTQLIRQWRH